MVDISHIILKTQPSPRATGMPHYLKGQSHFLVPIIVTFRSFIYFLCLPSLSQPNNTHVFLSCYPFVLSDVNMTTTKPSPNVTHPFEVILRTKYLHKIQHISEYRMSHVFNCNRWNYTYLIRCKWPNVVSSNQFIFRFTDFIMLDSSMLDNLSTSSDIFLHHLHLYIQQPLSITSHHIFN